MEKRKRVIEPAAFYLGAAFLLLMSGVIALYMAQVVVNLVK